MKKTKTKINRLKSKIGKIEDRKREKRAERAVIMMSRAETAREEENRQERLAQERDDEIRAIHG